MAPKVVKFRFKDSMRVDRYLPVDQVWEDELNVEKFEPQHGTDFKERVEYFAFCCTCQTEPYSCDKDSPQNHFKAYIYALGDSRKGILAAKKQNKNPKRIILPKKPYDNSESDEDSNIQSLIKTKKSKRLRNKQGKALAWDVRGEKFRKTMKEYNAKKTPNTLKLLCLDKPVTQAGPSIDEETMRKMRDELEYYKSIVEKQEKHPKNEDIAPSKKLKLMNVIESSSEESGDQKQKNTTAYYGKNVVLGNGGSILHEKSNGDETTESIEEVSHVVPHTNASAPEPEDIERVTADVTNSNSTSLEPEIGELDVPTQEELLTQNHPNLDQNDQGRIELAGFQNGSDEGSLDSDNLDPDNDQGGIELAGSNNRGEQELPIQNDRSIDQDQARVRLIDPNDRCEQPARQDRPGLRAIDPSDPDFLEQVDAELEDDADDPSAIEHWVHYKVKVKRALFLDEDEKTKVIGSATKILTNSNRDAKEKSVQPARN
ncbi:hypothetical protein QAD02_018099 [Eretmocerus hayati]|uniref:Uncharacterized protein n=1 Tax=Eretmocerus hayati TaxID=131215 RepID=A0ACC2PFQ8_9HYME|nr:hypothetical protein QAD02_018099 [Eretmocerus hayati]